jgi:hypothetical protein
MRCFGPNLTRRLGKDPRCGVKAYGLCPFGERNLNYIAYSFCIRSSQRRVEATRDEVRNDKHVRMA